MAYVSFSIMLILHVLCSWLVLLEGNGSCEKSFPDLFCWGHCVSQAEATCLSVIVTTWEEGTFPCKSKILDEVVWSLWEQKEFGSNC